MPSIAQLRSKFRSMSDKKSSYNDKESSRATSKQNTANTATAADNSRSIIFDLNNELTRQQAQWTSAGDEETVTSGHRRVPPAYSRSKRDSGISIKSEDGNSSKRRSSRSLDLSPASRRSLSSSRSLPAREARLSFGADDSRRMSLGPAMEQWRLEEDEEWQRAEQNGEVLPVLLSPVSSMLSSASSGALSAWPSRSPFDEDTGRRLSLVAAMDQWRLEEDEDARRTNQTTPAVSKPTSLPLPVVTSTVWPTLSKRSFEASGEGAGLPMTLGPAMEKWRLDDEEELRMIKQSGAVIPVLLPPASPRPSSEWPLQSPFDEGEGRRTSVVAAMEQWRAEAENGKQARQHNETTSPAEKSRPARPSFGQEWPSRSPFDEGEGRRTSVVAAMEQWRAEAEDAEEDRQHHETTSLAGRPRQARPSFGQEASGHKPVARNPTVEQRQVEKINALRREPERVMTLGPAMETWRLEEVCW